MSCLFLLWDVSHGLQANHGGLGKRKRCEYLECNKISFGGKFCRTHGGGRRCQQENCNKYARKQGFCIFHAGGRCRQQISPDDLESMLCQQDGCKTLAQRGSLCFRHGGGSRCQQEGCKKAAQRGGLCVAHGGGKRCQNPECDRTVKGPSGFCLLHDGSELCQHGNCRKRAKLGGRCFTHGGAPRCKVEKCNKMVESHGLCRVHNRGQEGATAETSEPLAEWNVEIQLPPTASEEELAVIWESFPELADPDHALTFLPSPVQSSDVAHVQRQYPEVDLSRASNQGQEGATAETSEPLAEWSVEIQLPPTASEEELALIWEGFPELADPDHALTFLPSPVQSSDVAHAQRQYPEADLSSVCNRDQEGAAVEVAEPLADWDGEIVLPSADAEEILDWMWLNAPDLVDNP
ncbi:MAG: hypothetical protein OXT67_11330 [Zetaproteobacteria bacterium]|nr:hypothetical protein [Zetaproteobacteria bacterium]